MSDDCLPMSQSQNISIASMLDPSWHAKSQRVSLSVLYLYHNERRPFMENLYIPINACARIFCLMACLGTSLGSLASLMVFEFILGSMVLLLLLRQSLYLSLSY